MTLIRGKSYLPQKSWAFKAPTGPSSCRSNQGLDQNYKDPLNNNPPRLLEAHAPSPKTKDVAWFMQKDQDQIILTVLQAQTLKRGQGRDKFKAKSLDVYCNKSHIECYNFRQ